MACFMRGDVLDVAAHFYILNADLPAPVTSSPQAG
jgi:hypothetical protein